MEMLECEFCQKGKTAIVCDKCRAVSCKKCSCFVDEDSFSYFSFLPEQLKYKTFCPPCYDGEIADQLAELEEILLKAKDVNVYMNDQGTETRLMRRVPYPIKIEGYEDRQEALMALAFEAAKKGYDTIVDVDLKSVKTTITGNYKKQIWSGQATLVADK